MLRRYYSLFPQCLYCRFRDFLRANCFVWKYRFPLTFSTRRFDIMIERWWIRHTYYVLPFILHYRMNIQFRVQMFTSQYMRNANCKGSLGFTGRGSFITVFETLFCSWSSPMKTGAEYIPLLIFSRLLLAWNNVSKQTVCDSYAVC